MDRPRPQSWIEELERIAEEAAGDAGLYVALVALRKTENGPDGNQFGVMSILDSHGRDAVTTYDGELRVAAKSFRNREREWRKQALEPRDRYGFFTDPFLRAFSSRWAPTHGAANDPKGLNANHALNLVRLATGYRLQVTASLMKVGLGASVVT